MKQLTYLLWMCGLFFLAACSSDDPQSSTLPQINIEKTHYSLAKGCIEVKLIADAPVSADTEIPFFIYENANENADYILSANSFLLKAGESEATITITRPEGEIGENSTELTLNLNRNAAPKGFHMGLINYTTIELMGKNATIVSFTTKADLLTMQSDFKIRLEKLDGSTYRVKEATDFEVEADPSSTAVEGVHYEFVGKHAATVPRNKNEGTVSIKFLKKEEGKDRLVLRLAEKVGYTLGSNPTIAITVQGPYNISGTWAFKSIVNQEWWATNWYVDTSNFPKGSSEDQITFTGNSYEHYTFTPKIQGDLKNYFDSACSVTYQGERNEKYEEVGGYPLTTANITVLEFEQINVNFSAKNISNRKAVVGFRILREGNTETLECTIYDYEPTDFLEDIYDMFLSYANKPVMLEAPLRLHFTRVVK